MSRSSLENRPSQTARIVDLLRSRSPHWVSLPKVLELRISQYSARIHQARHEWGEPGIGVPLSGRAGDCSPAVVLPSLFGDLAPERYRD